jgi:hypothetical protein
MSELKYARYVITEDLAQPPPPGFRNRLEEQRKAGNYLVSTHMLSLNDTIAAGALYFDCVWMWDKKGTDAVSLEIAHSHDFNEILGFMGSNRENPRELGAEIEIWLEDEQYIITSSALIYAPAGLSHGPISFRKIDSPILFFTGGNGTSYTRATGSEE